MLPFMLALVSKRRGYYHTVVDYPGQYIYRNERESTNHNRICSDIMDVSAWNYFKKFVLIAIGGYSYVTVPGFYSFFLDTKITTTACKIPYVEAKSDAEFWINFGFQWAVFVHTFFSYMGIETTMTIFENYTLVAPQLIHYGLDETIKKYEEKEFTESQMRIAFRNTLHQSFDYDK